MTTLGKLLWHPLGPYERLVTAMPMPQTMLPEDDRSVLVSDQEAT